MATSTFHYSFWPRRLAGVLVYSLDRKWCVFPRRRNQFDRLHSFDDTRLHRSGAAFSRIFQALLPGRRRQIKPGVGCVASTRNSLDSYAGSRSAICQASFERATSRTRISRHGTPSAIFTANAKNCRFRSLPPASIRIRALTHI